MKRVLVLAALLPIPAFAGGLTPVEPEPFVAPVAVAAPAPIYDFSGPSVGLVLGYGDVETDGSAELEGDGILGGISLNYDVDFGRTIAGATFDYLASDIELGDDGPTLDSVWRLGGRVGIDLNRNWVYGTAGYAVADVSDGIDDADGYFAGLGYEVFLTERVTAGAEVLYHDFDEFDGDSDLDATATTAEFSVNFRF